MGLLSLKKTRDRLRHDKRVIEKRIKKGEYNEKLEDINWRLKNVNKLIYQTLDKYAPDKYSLQEKLDYYQSRMKDKSLSIQQRAYAKVRFKQLKSEM